MFCENVINTNWFEMKSRQVIDQVIRVHISQQINKFPRNYFAERLSAIDISVTTRIRPKVTSSALTTNLSFSLTPNV